MINAGFLLERSPPPIAICGAGVALVWLAKEPPGLLVAVTGIGPNPKRAEITLERIIRDANSASAVVSRIRALLSQTGKTRSPGGVTEVIPEACRLMAGKLTITNIRVETGFDRNLPPALIERLRLQQVLVHLLRNAIDALDAKGDGTRLIWLRAAPNSDNANCVEARDYGGGMKEPECVFRPFFLTKENGMGMGLAICRSFIETHDGRLWATGNKPRGSIPAIALPIHAKNAA